MDEKFPRIGLARARTDSQNKNCKKSNLDRSALPHTMLEI